MSQYLPWISLVLGLGALGLGWSRAKDKKTSHLPLAGFALLMAGLLPAAAFLIVGAVWPNLGSMLDWVPYLVGLILGGAAMLAVDALDEADRPLGAGAIGLLAAGLFFALPNREGMFAAQGTWSFLLGATAAACALGWNRRGPSAAVVSGSALALSVLGYLGEVRGVVDAVEGPAALAIGAVVAGAAAWLASGQGKNKAVGEIVGVVVLAGAGYLLAWRVINLPSAGWGYMAGALVALALHWAMDREGDNRTLIGVAGILWLGVATFAFSRSAGYGIAAAALGSVSALVLLGRVRLLLACSPLLALAAYRSFYEAYGQQTKAFDIGQHYGMIGVLAGILLVLALVDLAKMAKLRDCWKPTQVGALGAAALGAGLAAASLLLAAKGVVGLIVGLGAAPIIAAMAGARGGGAFAVSAAGIAFLSLFFKVSVEAASQPREDRMVMMGGAFALALILAVAAWVLARSMSGDLDEKPVV